MNDFGVNIEGTRAIYNARAFYKRDASKEERTFTCESGPGCSHDAGGLPGLAFGARTIKARWADGTTDTIDSYSIEAIINSRGREIPKPDDGLATVEDIAYVVRLEDEEKPVFIPVKATAPIQAESAVPKQANAATQTAVEVTQKAKASAPRASAAPVDITSPEYVQIYAAAIAKRKVQAVECKHGHPVNIENANPPDLRRDGKYCCLPCIKNYAKK